MYIRSGPKKASALEARARGLSRLCSCPLRGYSTLSSHRERWAIDQDLRHLGGRSIPAVDSSHDKSSTYQVNPFASLMIYNLQGSILGLVEELCEPQVCLINKEVAICTNVSCPFFEHSYARSDLHTLKYLYTPSSSPPPVILHAIPLSQQLP